MKGITIWLMKKVYGIDVDSLRKDKESLSEKLMRMEEENTGIQNKNQELDKQIVFLKSQIEEQRDKFKKVSLDYKSSISQLKGTLDEVQQDNEGLKTSLDEANKEIEYLKEREKHSDSTSEGNSYNDEALDEIENLKRQYANLQELYEKAQNDNQKQNARIKNQESTIENLEKTNNDQIKQIDSQSKEIAGLKMQLQSVGKEDVSSKSNEKSIVEESSPTMLTDNSTIVIVDPVKDNDTPPKLDSTKRTIDTVIDIENDEVINAEKFFSQPESVVFKMRTELEKAIYLHRPKYVCKYCGQMVKISGRKTERGLARFFSHLRDSDDCDYKTTTGRTRREINREKYARCNEGERHKFLKAEIAKYLEMTNGVTDVRTENTVKGNHPILRWRRPDVIANYRDQEVVFELQLSTTFVSVIAERDLFYRLNKKHIIWISNFDDQEEHVDLTNMMIKDIYYNNRMNLFIFDLDAQRKSEELGELILKCNWLTSDGNWQYPNGNTYDQLGGKFVKLSDLIFDNTFKPYYIDAEQTYYAAHPEFKIKVANIEEENKEILAELDRLWEEERSLIYTEQQKTEENIQDLIEENEIDG